MASVIIGLGRSKKEDKGKQNNWNTSSCSQTFPSSYEIFFWAQKLKTSAIILPKKKEVELVNKLTIFSLLYFFLIRTNVISSAQVLNFLFQLRMWLHQNVMFDSYSNFCPMTTQSKEKTNNRMWMDWIQLNTYCYLKQYDKNASPISIENCF